VGIHKPQKRSLNLAQVEQQRTGPATADHLELDLSASPTLENVDHKSLQLPLAYLCTKTVALYPVKSH
jgi:hypothetical protein